MSTNFTITGEGLVPEPAYEVAPPGEQGEKGRRQGGVDLRLHLPQRRRGGPHFRSVYGHVVEGMKEREVQQGFWSTCSLRKFDEACFIC